MCVWFPRELNSKAWARREYGLWSTLPSSINITYYTQNKKKINQRENIYPCFSCFPSYMAFKWAGWLVGCTNTVSSFRLCPCGYIHQLNSSPHRTGLNKVVAKHAAMFSSFLPIFHAILADNDALSTTKQGITFSSLFRQGQYFRPGSTNSRDRRET